MELIKLLLITFLIGFVVFYGIISFGKYVDDKVNNPEGLMEAVCAAVVIMIIAVML